MKYIGIKLPHHHLGSMGTNVGDIWELQENGKYVCKTRDYEMEEWQILHDLNLGYLQPYEEGYPMLEIRFIGQQQSGVTLIPPGKCRHLSENEGWDNFMNEIFLRYGEGRQKETKNG